MYFHNIKWNICTVAINIKRNEDDNPMENILAGKDLICGDIKFSYLFKLWACMFLRNNDGDHVGTSRGYFKPDRSHYEKACALVSTQRSFCFCLFVFAFLPWEKKVSFLIDTTWSIVTVLLCSIIISQHPVGLQTNMR